MKNLIKKIGFISIGLALAFAGVVSADRTFTLPNQTGHSGQFLQTNGTNPLWASAGGGSGGITGTGTVNFFPRIATVDGSNNILTLVDGSAFEDDNYYVISKQDLIGNDTAGLDLTAVISGVAQGSFITTTSISNNIFRNQIFYSDNSGTSYIEQRPDGTEISIRDASNVNTSSIQMDSTSISLFAQNITPSDKFLYATGGTVTLGDVDGLDTATVLNISPVDNTGLFYNGALNATFGINKSVNNFTADIYGTPVISAPVFTGSGLNNMTSGGTFTGTNGEVTYNIVISSASIPDTVNILKNGVTIAINVPITGTAQTIADGVTFTFATTVGHTASDYWTITATPNGIYNTSNGAYYNNNKFLIGQNEDKGNIQIGLRNGLAMNDASINNVLIGQYSFESATNFSGITSVGNSNGWNTIDGSYDLMYFGHDNKFDDVDLHSGVVIGANVTGYSNTFVSGSDDFVIGDVFFGSGKISASPQTTTIHGTGGDGTDTGGADLILAGGIGTGASIGGSVNISTSAPGGSGSAPNNLQQSVQFDGNGNIRASRLHNNATAQGGPVDQDIRSGTYTPTLTGVTNVSSSTPRLASWNRVGNVVTVAGQIDVTATSVLTGTKIGVSLPVPSDFTTAYQAGGSGNSTTITSSMHGVAIYADATNNRAEFAYYTAISGSDTMTYSFTYEVK